MPSNVASIFKSSIKKLDQAERSELSEHLDRYRKVTDEWLRRQILDNNRIDILCTEFLGMEIKPFHRKLQQFQFLHPHTLQLVFRGAGKTTTCTIAKAIHYLLKDPNLRILIVSRAQMKAESFLREIKSHFESNVRLAEVFGEYYDPRKVNKWDNKEIDVLPRTKFTKESNISTVSVEGSLVGKHFDIILSDDLVEESSVLTQHMRDKTQSWYYQTLDPTLEPPDPEVPHRGEHHIVGTRYHFADHYGHLIENELKNAHQIIPALNEKGQSPWPEKFSPKFLNQKRKRAGIIIFGCQFLCNAEAMKGEIFQFDDCQVIEDRDIPSDLRIFMGVDLAISEDEKADHFAIVVIGKDAAGNIYILDFLDTQMRFNSQTRKIGSYYKKYDPIRIGVENNAYQAAQCDNLRETYEGIRVKGIKTDKDKITRAWKLSALFEDKKIFFRKSGNVHLFIEQLVLFPSYRYDDLFDALELAVRVSKMKKRRKRSHEPGVL